MRYMVSGRPQIGGRDAVSRGGLNWPRSGVLVEVADTDGDPPVDPKEKEGAPRRIGRNTWKALQEDKILISITPEGEVEKDGLALREENARLRARLAEMEGGKPGADDEEGGPKKQPHARK